MNVEAGVVLIVLEAHAFSRCTGFMTIAHVGDRRCSTILVDLVRKHTHTAQPDACAWQAAPTKAMPTHVPAGTREHLTTPCGLLFNELLKSPKVMLM